MFEPVAASDNAKSPANVNPGLTASGTVFRCHRCETWLLVFRCKFTLTFLIILKAYTPTEDNISYFYFVSKQFHWVHTGRGQIVGSIVHDHDRGMESFNVAHLTS